MSESSTLVSSAAGRYATALFELASEAGAVVMPPVPAFYHRPKTIDDIVNQTVNRVLDQFEIELETDLFERWQGAQSTSP